MENIDLITKTSTLGFELKREVKSKIVIGNFTIFLTKKFNWFNRLMMKLVFGLNIEKVSEDINEKN